MNNAIIINGECAPLTDAEAIALLASVGAMDHIKLEVMTCKEHADALAPLKDKLDHFEPVGTRGIPQPGLEWEVGYACGQYLDASHGKLTVYATSAVGALIQATEKLADTGHPMIYSLEVKG